MAVLQIDSKAATQAISGAIRVIDCNSSQEIDAKSARFYREVVKDCAYFNHVLSG
jgi:hypothetical protein